MKHDTQQHPLEIRMEKIARGYRGIEDKTMWLVFEEGKLLSDEVVTRLQRGSNAFARVKLAEAELKTAIEERAKLIPSLKRLCGEATVVAKRHYGGDAEKMATFGVEKRAPATAKSGTAKPKEAGAKAKRHPHLLGPGCGGANLIEEVVTTVVEEVVIPCEEEHRHQEKARCRSPKRSHSRR